jgi:hypothetical protein
MTGKTLLELWQAKLKTLQLQESSHPIDNRDAQTLHSYTVECPLYQQINKAMREGNDRYLHSRRFKPLLDYIYHLHRALPAAVPLSKDVTTLYRGIRYKVSKDHYKPGNHITWHAFSSTTTDLCVALQFAQSGGSMAPNGTVFIIQGVKSPKGIARWSQHPEEEEWLYNFNAQFHVGDPYHAEQELLKHTDELNEVGWNTSDIDFIHLIEV